MSGSSDSRMSESKSANRAHYWNTSGALAVKNFFLPVLLADTKATINIISRQNDRIDSNQSHHHQPILKDANDDFFNVREWNNLGLIVFKTLL